MLTLEQASSAKITSGEILSSAIELDPNAEDMHLLATAKVSSNCTAQTSTVFKQVEIAQFTQGDKALCCGAPG